MQALLNKFLELEEPGLPLVCRTPRLVASSALGGSIAFMTAVMPPTSEATPPTTIMSPVPICLTWFVCAWASPYNLHNLGSLIAFSVRTTILSDNTK